MTVEHSLRNELITAIFVDFENLALGAEEDKKGRFDIELVLKRCSSAGGSCSSARTATGAATKTS